MIAMIASTTGTWPDGALFDARSSVFLVEVLVVGFGPDEFGVTVSVRVRGGGAGAGEAMHETQVWNRVDSWKPKRRDGCVV